MIAFFLTGVHTLSVDGTFSASNGVAQFHLGTVTVDDIAMPQMVVDYLIDRYLKRRYPDIAIDRPFSLYPSIDKVIVEQGNVLVTGRQ